MDPNKGPKACTTCAKAKARCIPGGDGDKCERYVFLPLSLLMTNYSYSMLTRSVDARV